MKRTLRHANSNTQICVSFPLVQMHYEQNLLGILKITITTKRLTHIKPTKQNVQNDTHLYQLARITV
jgi:hypothetical protein